MKVDLPPDLEKMVADKVSGGEYASASEVIRDALRLMSEAEELDSEQIDWLRDELEIGERDFREGRFTTFKTDEEVQAFFDSLK